MPNTTEKDTMDLKVHIYEGYPNPRVDIQQHLPWLRFLVSCSVTNRLGFKRATI